jgi:hypothetical protein
VRDYYDSVKPELESKIFSLLGAPWTIDFDVHSIYQKALEMPGHESQYAFQNPGMMLAECVEALLSPPCQALIMVLTLPTCYH